MKERLKLLLRSLGLEGKFLPELASTHGMDSYFWLNFNLLKMAKLDFSSFIKRKYLLALVLAAPLSISAAELGDPTAKPGPKVAAASNEGELAIKRFQVAPGLKADLWAAEPMLANPVAIATDEKGRWYVAETFRHTDGVLDIRNIMPWLEQELASTNVATRSSIMKEHLGAEGYQKLGVQSERVKLIEDRSGSGKADHDSIFADGFNDPLDGIGAGLLARNGTVYYTCIPNLWMLKDTKGTGTADVKKAIHTGFGVRVAFLGHDLHGLRIGPDGKLYFSVGDRGGNINTPEGKNVSNPEMGVVYRCNQDGSDLEIFATGLRNPQELAFDQYGNLFTGDNNSDAGDPARWVYVVEGSDSGWRVGWQFIQKPAARGPWLMERLCYPQWEGQASYILPPVSVLGNGPSGLTYYPGTGLPDSYKEHFFMANFSGNGNNSGVFSVSVKPKGAGYQLEDNKRLIWNILATDVEMGVDGGAYVSDWVSGWNKTGKGRIYRIHDEKLDNDPVILETKKIIGEGMAKRSVGDLVKLLHAQDMRVRQEAQFELAARKRSSLSQLERVAKNDDNTLARLHAVWALGQIGREGKNTVAVLEGLLKDKDAEVRAQAAKILGTFQQASSTKALISALADPAPRVQAFAAISLQKLGARQAADPLVDLLRHNESNDAVIRHAATFALTTCADATFLRGLRNDSSRLVRLGAVVALRKMKSDQVSEFLADADPLVVAEAARAINDESIAGGFKTLADLASKSGEFARLSDGTREMPGPKSAILRRVVNANWRLGRNENAASLAAIARNEEIPPGERVEALQDLGEWSKPANLDHVTGLYRPLEAREISGAASALESALPAILENAPEQVQLAAMASAGKLGIKSAGNGLFAKVIDVKVRSTIRVEALKTLAALIDEHLSDAVKFAAEDQSEPLRNLANSIKAKLKPSDASEGLVKILKNGTIGEKQNAVISLGGVEGKTADAILSDMLDQYVAGQIPVAMQLDLIEAANKRSTPVIKEKLKKLEASRDKSDQLAPYRMLLEGGNAAEGKKIFFEKAEASCVRCHKLGEEGADVGPQMLGIGTRATREYILESIIFPNAKIAPGFESVIVVLKSGISYAGILKGETDKELTILSPEDGLLKLAKSDITKRDRGLSAMVEGFVDILPKRDIRDLVEFLSSQK
ncbi:MAG: hypothetical protein JWM04_899 [Verrucomicrobiales bacterium]|nr:hypothetical protein [Verrucomicrobiales bacterium]